MIPLTRLATAGVGAWKRPYCEEDSYFSVQNKIYFECRAIFASEENELSLRLSSAGRPTNDTSALCLFLLDIS